MKRLVTIIFALIGFYSFGQVTYVGSATSSQIGGLNVPSGRSALVYDSTLGQYGFENSASLWYWLITEADIDTFAELDAIVADQSLATTSSAQTLTNKTISGASNTLSGIPTTALSNGDKGAITVTSGILTIDTGAVTTSQILDGTIGGVDISDGAVGGAAVLDGSLTGADIADGFIAEVDLNASVNASLDLADSAVQPGDNISTLTNDAGYITSQTDDQTAAEVSVAATPSNYTAATADVEAHLAGIDTALGSVGGGSGDVVGPASATDNAIARFDGTTGKLVQNSEIAIDDSGNIEDLNGRLNFVASNGTGVTDIFRFTGDGISSGTEYLNFNNAGQLSTSYSSLRILVSASTAAAAITSGGWSTQSGYQFRWSQDANPAGTPDTGLERYAAGVVGVTNGSTGEGDLYLNDLTASGDLRVNGGDIGSTTSLNVNLDTDNNGTESFNIVDGAAATVFSVAETGVVTGNAASMTVDASGFSGNLSVNDSTIQDIANGLDALVLTATLSDADYGDITVSGSGTAMNIDNGVIEAVNLEATNAATDGFFPSYDSATGGFTWENLSATGGLSVTDIGASDKTLTSSDFGKFNYTDDSIILTLDDTPSNGERMVLQPTNIDSVIYVRPSGSVNIVGNGAEVISAGFSVDSLNAATLTKLASNLYSVIGYVKNYATGITIEATTTTNSGAADVSSLNVTYPSGIQANDVIIIMIVLEETTTGPKWDNTTGKPSGFTLINEAGDTTTDIWPGAFYKVAAGTESGTINVPCINCVGGRMAAVAIRLSGVNTASVVGQTGADSNTLNSVTSNAIPGVTTTTNGELAIAWGAVHGSDTNPVSGAGTGWTDKGNIDIGDNIQGSLIANWGTLLQETAGATGNYTISWTTTDGSSGFIFSLNPQ